MTFLPKINYLDIDTFMSHSLTNSNNNAPLGLKIPEYILKLKSSLKTLLNLLREIILNTYLTKLAAAL